MQLSISLQSYKNQLTVSLIKLMAGASGGKNVGEAGRDRLVEALEDGTPDGLAGFKCEEL